MLPESLKEIAEIIGVVPAIQLARDFGGTEIYIPKNMTADHPIAVCIGLEAATKLAEWAIGDRIEIPRAVGVHLGKRNAEIREAVEQGLSKKKAARKFQLTTRWIRYLVNGSEDDPDQKKLF